MPGYVPLPLRVTRDGEPTLAVALQAQGERNQKPEPQARQNSADHPANEALHGEHARDRRAGRESGDRDLAEVAREEESPASPRAGAAQPAEPQAADAPRLRREAMLKQAPPFPSIAAAQRAYSAGKIDADTFEDTVWVLKTRRNERIEIEKDNLKKGAISAQEYEWRLGRIDAELRGE